MGRRPVFPLLNVTLQHYNLMTRLFNAGWAANVVQKYMKDAGMGYRRSTIQATRRKVLGLLKHEDMFRKWKAPLIIHKGYFEEIEFGAPFNYRINFYVDATDAITGKVDTIPMTGLFDTFINPDQITPEMLLRLNPDVYERYSEFSNIVVRNVEHQVGAPY